MLLMQMKKNTAMCAEPLLILAYILMLTMLKYILALSLPNSAKAGI